MLAFQSRVPVILSHWGSGTSFKYAQLLPRSSPSSVMFPPKSI